MAFKKVGSPGIISKVTTTDPEFNTLRQKIAQENNLIRCSSCDKLISKKGSDGTSIDIQHKHLSMTIINAEKIKIQCPACGQVNNII